LSLVDFPIRHSERTPWRLLRIVGLATLALAGCDHAHILNEQDALACEAQGLVRGTDYNADCALKRAEARKEAGIPDPVTEHVIPTGPPPGTGHAAGATQTTPTYAAAGTTTTVAFYPSINPDCSPASLPAIRIGLPPEHGGVTLAHHEGFARDAKNVAAEPCGGQASEGLAVDYTPSPGFTGVDSLSFWATAKDGVVSSIRVPIAVQKPSASDE
jgi:hypothetical protein